MWKQKKKKGVGVEKRIAGNQQVGKKSAVQMRVSLPEKEQHMHQKVYAFPAGQQRLQMQYA